MIQENFPFNSLYEIRSRCSSVNKYNYPSLSILFMRFPFVYAIFPLFFKQLSILFMRFILDYQKKGPKYKQVFQFSLWDSGRRCWTSWTSHSFTFNSLYEILAKSCIYLQKFISLSILFMRFFFGEIDA